MRDLYRDALPPNSEQRVESHIPVFLDIGLVAPDLFRAFDDSIFEHVKARTKLPPNHLIAVVGHTLDFKFGDNGCMVARSFEVTGRAVDVAIGAFLGQGG